MYKKKVITIISVITFTINVILFYNIFMRVIKSSDRITTIVVFVIDLLGNTGNRIDSGFHYRIARFVGKVKKRTIFRCLQPC